MTACLFGNIYLKWRDKLEEQQRHTAYSPFYYFTPKIFILRNTLELFLMQYMVFRCNGEQGAFNIERDFEQNK